MNAIEITILSIIIMIGLGYFLKRIDFLSEKDIEPFNKIVMYILMPCMIFHAIYSADLSLLPKLAILPFVILASSFATGIVSYFILRSIGLDDIKLWSVLVTVMIANTAFMGYPVNLGVYGQEGFLRAIFCDMATLCIFLLLSFVLILKFGGTVKSAFKKIIFFPPLWAVVLGLGFNWLNVPIGPILDNTVNYLGQGAIPLIMVTLGLSIDFSALSRSKSMIAFTSVMKLAFFPLVAFFIASQLGLVDLQYNVSIIEAAMPSGMMSLLLAITYKLDYELTSDCILINTVISLITLPAIMMLL
ncbi:MAG: AEC family transporter [Methanobrevibacter sp.]|uniref:AEC family transporter n=1 Tax=Methanobrevibacter sp. TaxID=66852 RepID=UPI0025CDBF19|nr:AEC family transporter [Methanobrevibacter sp.]MBR3112965.1 AEC family transporter [Methanobrevibacter sp.]MBR6992820.1 AEC family transporter [Methanobrevibacter sp.]